MYRNFILYLYLRCEGAHILRMLKPYTYITLYLQWIIIVLGFHAGSSCLLTVYFILYMNLSRLHPVPGRFCSRG